MDLTLCHWKLNLILHIKKPDSSSLDYGLARTVSDVHSVHKVMTYKLKQSPNLIWYLVLGQTQRPRPHRFLVHVDKYMLISVQLIMLLGCTPVV